MQHTLSKANLFERFHPNMVPYQLNKDTCYTETHPTKPEFAKAVSRYHRPNLYIDEYKAYTTGVCRQDYLGNVIIQLTRPNHHAGTITTPEKITFNEYSELLHRVNEKTYPKFTCLSHRIFRQTRYLTLSQIGSDKHDLRINHYHANDYWMDYHIKQKPNGGIITTLVNLLPFMKERRYFYSFTYLILTLG